MFCFFFLIYLFLHILSKLRLTVLSSRSHHPISSTSDVVYCVLSILHTRSHKQKSTQLAAPLLCSTGRPTLTTRTCQSLSDQQLNRTCAILEIYPFLFILFCEAKPTTRFAQRTLMRTRLTGIQVTCAARYCFEEGFGEGRSRKCAQKGNQSRRAATCSMKL